MQEDTIEKVTAASKEENSKENSREEEEETTTNKTAKAAVVEPLSKSDSGFSDSAAIMPESCGLPESKVVKDLSVEEAFTRFDKRYGDSVPTPAVTIASTATSVEKNKKSTGNDRMIQNNNVRNNRNRGCCNKRNKNKSAGLEGVCV